MGFFSKSCKEERVFSFMSPSAERAKGGRGRAKREEMRRRRRIFPPRGGTYRREQLMSVHATAVLRMENVGHLFFFSFPLTSSASQYLAKG